ESIAGVFSQTGRGRRRAAWSFRELHRRARHAMLSGGGVIERRKHLPGLALRMRSDFLKVAHERRRNTGRLQPRQPFGGRGGRERRFEQRLERGAIADSKWIRRIVRMPGEFRVSDSAAESGPE